MVFTKQKYMLGDDCSMLDVALALLLWRLCTTRNRAAEDARAGALSTPSTWFSRQGFIDALTPVERGMRRWLRRVLRKTRHLQPNNPAFLIWSVHCNGMVRGPGLRPYLCRSRKTARRVPAAFVKNGEIVLNVGPLATHHWKMDNDWVLFITRFKRGLARGRCPVPAASASSQKRLATAWASAHARRRRADLADAPDRSHVGRQRQASPAGSLCGYDASVRQRQSQSPKVVK